MGYIAIIEIAPRIGYSNTTTIQLIDKIEMNHKLIEHVSPMSYEDSFKEIIKLFEFHEIDSILYNRYAYDIYPSTNIVLRTLAIEFPNIPQVHYAGVTRFN
jgi:hypothetical protein